MPFRGLDSMSNNSSTTTLTSIKKDRFACLGDGRSATYIVSAIALVGILVFLAVPLTTPDPVFSLILKAYYTLASAFIIFGIISIVKYSPVLISIYVPFFVFTGVASSVLNILTIVFLSKLFMTAGNSCNELTANCPGLKTALLLGANVLQILFWGVACPIVLRFYSRFRSKYALWKSSYSKSTGPDAHFQHWVFRNDIDDSNMSVNCAMDSLA